MSMEPPLENWRDKLLALKAEARAFDEYSEKCDKKPTCPHTCEPDHCPTFWDREKKVEKNEV